MFITLGGRVAGLDKWDENLDNLQFTLNTSKHSSTGFTPDFLNFGRILEPIQTLNKDLVNIEEINSQEISKFKKGGKTPKERKEKKIGNEIWKIVEETRKTGE